VFQTVEKLAFVSVSRGAGFGALGIICLMVGLSTNVARALEGGGICFLIMALVLMIKAKRAPTMNYRSTEIWIMLENHERPLALLAPHMINAARERALLYWAHLSAWAGAVLLGTAVPMLLL
jgi:hypothetical protein